MVSHVVAYVAIAFGVFAASIALSIYTYMKSSRKDIAARFAVWALTIAVIAFFEGTRKFYGLVKMPDEAFISTKMTQVGALLFVPAFVEFCHYFPPNKWRLSSFLVRSSVVISAILITLNLTTDFITEGVIQTPIGYSTDYGTGVIPFGLFFAGYSFESFIHFASKTWRRASYYRILNTLLGAVLVAGVVVNFIPDIQEVLYEPPSITVLSAATLIIMSNLVLLQRFLIIPVAEVSVEAPPRYSLRPGRSYVVYEKRPEKIFDALRDMMDHGYAGLCISRLHPDRLREEWGLHRAVILWLSEIDAENTVHPRDLGSLRFYIKSFSESVKNTIVVIQGLDYIIEQNGFKKTLRFVQRLSDHMAQSRSILVVSIGRELGHEEREALETEVEPL